MSFFPAVYEGLEPASVWRHFGALNSIPRPSGREEAARTYVQQLAESRRAMWKTDARGNICVRVPARGIPTDAPIVVLQSHLDMVCQKRPEVIHNFDVDPISPRRLEDKIYASGTTLGADNGMGAAMMMAILCTEELVHGPLELLFTVEEETGLFGAAHLDPELVRGRLLVNLDSEDPDEITIGCAGGGTTTLTLPASREATEGVFLSVGVGGLQGGHSGIQIGEPLGNAIKFLGQILNETTQSCPSLRVVSVDGGTAHNAIPRDSKAIISLSATELVTFDAVFAKVGQELDAKWRSHEPGLHLEKNNTTSSLDPLNAEATTKLLHLLKELPHGVAHMSERFAGKVQTSSNLASVHSSPDGIELTVSNRSFIAAELQAMQDKVAGLGHDTNSGIQTRDAYPGWEPSATSPLLEATAKAFEKATGRPPKVEVVHAGLECGLLSEKLQGLDAVSFGPLIRGAHTPEEWVSISSVEEIYNVLTTLLSEIK